STLGPPGRARGNNPLKQQCGLHFCSETRAASNICAAGECLASEDCADLDRSAGNKLRRGDFLAVAELGLSGVDAAALRGDHQPALTCLDHLAHLSLYRAEGAHQLLAAVEELQLHAVEHGPGAGR